MYDCICEFISIVKGYSNYKKLKAVTTEAHLSSKSHGYVYCNGCQGALLLHLACGIAVPEGIE